MLLIPCTCRLKTAIRKGDAKMVRIILKSKVNKTRRTALVRACEEVTYETDNREVVQLLLPYLDKENLQTAKILDWLKLGMVSTTDDRIPYSAWCDM